MQVAIVKRGARCGPGELVCRPSPCTSVMQLIIPGFKNQHSSCGALYLFSIASSFLPLSLSLSLVLCSQANRRQPHCQFHARVVSSAAEISHCKIDLNNRKVEQQGEAGGWNRESLFHSSERMKKLFHWQHGSVYRAAAPFLCSQFFTILIEWLTKKNPIHQHMNLTQQCILSFTLSSGLFSPRTSFFFSFHS